MTSLPPNVEPGECPLCGSNIHIRTDEDGEVHFEPPFMELRRRTASRIRDILGDDADWLEPQ